jgi:hypothetical protein
MRTEMPQSPAQRIRPPGLPDNRAIPDAAPPPRLTVMDASQGVAEVERILGHAGAHASMADALATLRRWEVDPLLDQATRVRARNLVWKIQPNGWDEA